MTAELLWMQLVAADPRYADALPMEACEEWAQSMSRPSEALIVDCDGDLWVTDDPMPYIVDFDGQIVMEDGVPQPCTDAMAHYLHLYMQHWHENTRFPYPVTGR